MSLRSQRWAVGAIFTVHGAVAGSFAARIPAVAEHLHLSPGALGLALVAPSVGSIAAMPLTGRLIHRIGARAATRVLIGLFCAVLALPAIAPSLPLLFGSLVLLGATAGTSDIAMNAQGSALEQRMGMSIMSGLHGMWSIGGFIAAGVATLVVSADVRAPVHLAVMAVVLLAIGQLVGPALPPSASPATRPPDVRAATAGGVGSGPLGSAVALGVEVAAAGGSVGPAVAVGGAVAAEGGVGGGSLGPAEGRVGGGSLGPGVAVGGAVAAEGGVGSGSLGPAEGRVGGGSLGPAATDASAGGDEVAVERPRFAFPTGIVLVIGLIGFCAVFGEAGGADWAAVYMRDVMGSGHAVAAATYGVFAASMAIGRLVGDRMIRRYGPANSVRATALAGVVGGLLVVTGLHPVLGVVGFGLLGVGISVAVPLVFAAAGRIGSDGGHAGAGNAIAGVATIAYGAGLAAPGAIGGFADLTSLRWSFVLVTVLVGIVAAIAGALTPRASGGAPIPAPPFAP